MEKVSISCIIPAFNEEKTIGGVVSVLQDLRLKGIDTEIIVVSDGSNDQTAERAREAGADAIIELEKNVGKGGAVIKGIKRATRDILLFLDADLVNLNVEHLQQMLAPVVKNEADMAIGFLTDMKTQNTFHFFSGQRVIKRVVVQDVIDDRKFSKSRFQFEILLNRLARDLKLKTIFIPLSNLYHLRKNEKYGKGKALSMNLKFLADVTVRTHKKQFLAAGLAFIALIVYVIFFSPIKVVGINFRYLPAPTPQDKILVVSAHPDDEVIGAGGYMADAAKNGAEVRVVITTNGDGSKLKAELIDRKVLAKPQDLIEEGKIRVGESRRALALSNIPQDHIYFLSFPDRELDELLLEHWDKPKTSKTTGVNQAYYEGSYKQGSLYTGRNLLDMLKGIISSATPTIIVTHNPYDTHSDHQTVYKFVSLAVNELSERGVVKRPKLYSFIVHKDTFEYPHPFRFDPRAPLYPPRKLKNICNWFVYPLSDSVEKLKLQEIKMYKSQLKNPYLRLLLESSVRTNELFCSDVKQ